MFAVTVLSGFILAIFAPWVSARAGSRAGGYLALLPALLTGYFLTWLPQVQTGPTLLSYPWVPGLDIHFSFLLDGLSLLFALMISTIGTLVILYTGAYMAGHRDIDRLYLLLLAFMASMLGLVLADNLITLFVFWELTSITSYLLIGFDHENSDSRRAALQGLLVTAGGGLALLAGLVLLGMAGGSLSLAELLQQGGALRDHALYLPILLLVLVGAFTKSAQVPFHFWLPNAMAAPTPVSAYLHSATMVKAGIYLLARLNPVLGGTQEWLLILSLVGAVTMLTGAVLAVRNSALKKILAYSTVMALGTLTLLIGIGTEAALGAALVFLLAHSLYKGALFLMAGVIDHQTGCKDVTQLGGLRRAMPLSALIAALAALSLAGVPPLFGFIAKELLLEVALETVHLGAFLVIVTVLAAALTVTAAGLVGFRPFFGAAQPTPKTAQEASGTLLMGPALLAALGLIVGLVPALVSPLLDSAIGATLGGAAPLELALWHGFTLALGLSLSALLAGLLGYRYWDRLRGVLSYLDAAASRVGPERLYDLGMDSLLRLAAWQTRLLQNGYLRNYIITIIATVAGLAGYTLATRHAVFPTHSLDVRFHEAVIAAMILLAALFAATTFSSLGAVAAVGATGFGVALIYVLFSAPDLGMTQVLVETLTVLLLVLVLYRLPGFARLSSPLRRLRDASVALLAGGLITWLLLITIDAEWSAPISGYFIENSQTLAHGRNIVNVILVDFRALDTLGEIFVLALAALGVYAMIKQRQRESC